jgi:hypothetical protein
MTRGAIFRFGLAGSAAVLALTAAQQPPALSGIKAGLWELNGYPGAKAPTRECIADVRTFARLEHRAANCTSNVISDNGKSMVVEYSCGGAGFGRSKIDVITPRSLRINTQGISSRVPFNYVLQAHRLDDCTAHVSASRH